MAGSSTHDAPLADTPDGPPGAPTCLDAWRDHTIVVDAPVAIAELNTGADERDPWLSGDELTIYFSKDVGVALTDFDIEVATRGSTSSAFTGVKPAGDPNQVTNGIDDDSQQAKIAMTADGLSAIYATDDSTTIPSQSGVDLFAVTRMSPTDPFANPTETHLGNVDNNKNQSDPWLSADGGHLYYADTQSSKQVIVFSAGDGSGDYGSPAPPPTGGTHPKPGPPGARPPPSAPAPVPPFLPHPP